MNKLGRKDDRDSFEARYSPRRSRAARKIEEIALGHAVGLQGYTTVEQADLLGELLQLRPQALLLDLGAGRGWPGSQVARAARCRLISADVPWEAVREAKQRSRREASEVVAADGQALPFRAGSIDAVVHADIFC